MLAMCKSAPHPLVLVGWPHVRIRLTQFFCLVLKRDVDSNGFSVPVTCSCSGSGVVTGCNRDLFSLNQCDVSTSPPPFSDPERFH